MPDIHLLTPGDLRQVTVACGARLPEYGTWDHRTVTCAACLVPPGRDTASVSSPRGMPERELQALVRQACQLHRWLYYHTHRSQHSPAGFPDTIALRGERLIAAELKRQRQEPTPAQTRWLEAFQRVKQVEVYTWRGTAIPTILQALR